MDVEGGTRLKRYEHFEDNPARTNFECHAAVGWRTLQQYVRHIKQETLAVC